MKFSRRFTRAGAGPYQGIDFESRRSEIRNPDGTMGLSPVVELNVRMTMGRVAFELLRKSRPGSAGHLRILRKGKAEAGSGGAKVGRGSLEGGTVLLNDPEQAREFLVVWTVE